MAPTPEGLIRRTWLNVVPALLITVGLFLMLLAAPRLAESRAAPSAHGASPPAAAKIDVQKLPQQVEDLTGQINELAQKREALKDRLDALSQQASQTQWLLSIVLAAAGLLTLAQGLFAFFSAQSYVKQASDAVQKIETLAEEVRTKYPLFSQMEDAREAAFRRLADLARRLDLDQNLYSDSDPQTRQEVLSLESFAATQFIASAARVPHILANLRLLGKFYADKYVSGGRAAQADFERALYYFTLELEKSGRDICALNDLGWLHTLPKTPNQETAEALMLESLRVSPAQQRPLYNLGTMIFDPADKAKLSRAYEYLKRAASLKNWEKTPNEEFACHVHYNLACTYSRLAEHEEDGQKKRRLLDLAAAALDRAAERGGTAQTTLEHDLLSEDLAALAQSAHHAPLLRSIQEKFRRAWEARAKA